MATILFGNKLKQLRQLQRLTLREVEEVAGISNAYLSQLENGKIKKPSAHVLYKLAAVYKQPIERLLEMAGLIEKGQSVPPKGYSIGNLTKEEEKKLLEYLLFIRTQQK